jgi:archaellum component FlaC
MSKKTSTALSDSAQRLEEIRNLVVKRIGILADIDHLKASLKTMKEEVERLSKQIDDIATDPQARLEFGEEG